MVGTLTGRKHNSALASPILTLEPCSVMCVGGSKKFQSFPIPWIAGQSTCRSLVYEAPQSPITGTFVDDSQNTYTAMSYLKVKPNCVEKAGVFA